MEELLELGSRFSDTIKVWSYDDRAIFDKAVRRIRKNPSADISECINHLEDRITKKTVE